MMDLVWWKVIVYVGGLVLVVINSYVLDVFILFGEIVEVQVFKFDVLNLMELYRGFVYVEYEDEVDVKEVIDNMDQLEFFGKVIKCLLVKVLKSVDEGFGSKKVVWEQVCYQILQEICVSMY